MKALIWDGEKARVINTRPLPRLRDDYILVRTVAVAINPTDCKATSQGRAATNGILGCDFAGIVEEVGAKVTKPWKKGHRVFGFAHGANSNNSEDGAFAEFITAKRDLCMATPEKMAFEEAASVAASAFTCGQGLFEEMKLNTPDNPIGERQYILIYGGSSSAGSLATQYCKLAGYPVLTTCSPNNNELCRSRGAEAVFDYNDTNCAQKIREYAQGELFLVWDTIGSQQGIEICMESMSTKPGHKAYGTILLNRITRQDVDYSSSILMTCLGEAFDVLGKHFPAETEKLEFAKRQASLTERLLREGKLKPHPVRVGGRDFHGVLDEGLPAMLEGIVSGVKLVYRVADT
ncbi:putative alcohol dehydrogenase [Exophiala viscosa]|uniref:putative alcohol dehydrogenase n=1 Tax=Exophiala viscosa TaxID=2486360 RepID=UPI00219E5DAC|nr:putative alcohol dehydrogenase [Exophiala viscosa]